jgi:hypothetical protein
MKAGAMKSGCLTNYRRLQKAPGCVIFPQRKVNAFAPVCQSHIMGI